MKLISFNVNSLRVRFHQLTTVIDKYNPEFISLQETKVQDEDFPLQQINELGYHVEFIGQKTHYGVATMSKVKPIWVQKQFDGDSYEAQKRIIFAKYIVNGKEITIINGYFPQGEARTTSKFEAKEKFYNDLYFALKNKFSRQDKIVLMGDMNVALHDNDVGLSEENKNRWLKTGKASFLPEERAWMQKILTLDFIDSYHKLYPNKKGPYSWYDYRSKGFQAQPARGLRIDQILLSRNLAESLVGAGIDTDIRAMEKPSDHCPIWAEVTL